MKEKSKQVADRLEHYLKHEPKDDDIILTLRFPRSDIGYFQMMSELNWGTTYDKIIYQAFRKWDSENL